MGGGGGRGDGGGGQGRGGERAGFSRSSPVVPEHRYGDGGAERVLTGVEKECWLSSLDGATGGDHEMSHGGESPRPPHNNLPHYWVPLF